MLSVRARAAFKHALSSTVPQLKRLLDERDSARAEAAKLRMEFENARSELSRSTFTLQSYVDSIPHVLQYRRAYFDVHGVVAPDLALPSAKAWPASGRGLTYSDMLTGLLPLTTGKGAEIGPLNIPIATKQVATVLYVDHLDREGLRKKYPTVDGIVEIDRPMVNNSLAETLSADAPLDYLVASQVMEHVPNPIRWMKEIAAVLRVGGLLAVSLPDRRATFDMFRDETGASDMVAAYMMDSIVPDVRAVYDHHAGATAVNMHWAIPESKYPNEIIAGKGAISPPRATDNHMRLAENARGGEYLDVHCWVLTPASFLLSMAHLANEGLLPFKCRQFYPTDLDAQDRINHSFVAILEKTSEDHSRQDTARSFLMPLGP